VGGSGNGTGTESRAGIGKGKGTGMGAGTGTGTGTGTEGNQGAFTIPSSSSSLEYHPDYTAPSSPTPSASCLSCARPLSQKPHFRHEDKIASLPHLVSTFEEEMSVLLARTQLDAHGGPPVDSSLTHSNSNSNFTRSLLRIYLSASTWMRGTTHASPSLVRIQGLGSAGRGRHHKLPSPCPPLFSFLYPIMVTFFS
jgi:hypothetical protein